MAAGARAPRDEPAAGHGAGGDGRSSEGILAALAALLAAALAVATWLGPGPRAGGLDGALGGWNVLLLSVDTLRADRLGAWGYETRPTSPRLDALVAEGTRFAHAVAPRALTWPSLSTVLTGRYPSGHGVTQNGYAIPDGLPMLPTLLRAAGYQTGAFLGNMCRANHQGWDALYCGKGVDSDVNHEALAWARELDPARPYFLWVHYFGAHSPYYNGGAVARQLVAKDYRGPVAPRKGALNRIMQRGLPLSAADVERLDALYDAAVIGTDRHAARLLEGLAAAGRRERTLVIFLADHGEDLYDHHGYIYHACSVYESGLHVPLAFVAPQVLPAGAVVEAPVELADVAPTVLDLLGLPAPAGMTGRSLVPALAQPARAEERPVFSEYGGPRVHTVLDRGWKLVANPDRHRPICFTGAPPGLYPIAEAELYDLVRDPGETRNLAAEHPERVAELAALIEERFGDVQSDGPAQLIPEDLKRELEGLGYVVP